MSERLRIGLLQCGYLPPDLVPEFGDYPHAFEALLSPFDLDLVTYDVQRAPLPLDPTECDGWLVSGSADSAYDDLDWIAPVEQFLRDVMAADVPLVAICFGHQLLAQALGGRVAKSTGGWGAGVHEYQLIRPDECPDVPSSGSVRLIASHQDQVIELPADAVVVATTAHCPVAAFTLGPRVLAIQPHPEFSADLSRRLISLRRERMGETIADSAMASLDEPLDQDVVARWMYNVLNQPATA